MTTLNDNISTTGHLSPSSPLFKELQILKIGDISKIRTLQFVFDWLNGFCPQFKSWLIISTVLHSHLTRSCATTLDNCNSLRTTNILFIPQARTTFYGLKSIKIKIWNNLPPIRSIKFHKLFTIDVRHNVLESIGIRFNLPVGISVDVNVLTPWKTSHAPSHSS